jgi:hypothetical protein
MPPAASTTVVSSGPMMRPRLVWAEAHRAVQIVGRDELGEQRHEAGAQQQAEAAIEEGAHGHHGHTEVAGEGQHREDARQQHLPGDAGHQVGPSIEAVRQGPTQR